jgi:hypothetical protein
MARRFLSVASRWRAERSSTSDAVFTKVANAGPSKGLGFLLGRFP